MKTSRMKSVNICFLKANEDKLSSERRWFFSPKGFHNAGDEEFIVRLNGGYLTADAYQTKEDWEVEQLGSISSHSLARFFLFDGEMVRDWAKMDMATQVKQGIEKLNGYPILRKLIEDLNSYSNRKRGEVRKPKSDENLRVLSAEIEDLKQKILLRKKTMRLLMKLIHLQNKEAPRRTYEFGYEWKSKSS